MDLAGAGAGGQTLTDYLEEYHRRLASHGRKASLSDIAQRWSGTRRQDARGRRGSRDSPRRNGLQINTFSSGSGSIGSISSSGDGGGGGGVLGISASHLGTSIFEVPSSDHLEAAFFA